MTGTVQVIPPREIEPVPPLTAVQEEQERRDLAMGEATAIVSGWNGVSLFQLTKTIAEHLVAAEERGRDPREVPELIPVFDWRPGDARPPDPADGGVIDPADYDQPAHGLQCPHCGEVTWDGEDCGIYVIDRAVRWSRFGFEVRMVDEYGYLDRPDGGRGWGRTGRRVEQHAVIGSYGDSDYQTEGYACESCDRRVALPEGVEEVGD
jgi:hypothetical protein